MILHTSTDRGRAGYSGKLHKGGVELFQRAGRPEYNLVQRELAVRVIPEIVAVSVHGQVRVFGRVLVLLRDVISSRRQAGAAGSAECQLPILVAQTVAYGCIVFISRSRETSLGAVTFVGNAGPDPVAAQLQVRDIERLVEHHIRVDRIRRVAGDGGRIKCEQLGRRVQVHSAVGRAAVVLNLEGELGPG